jgi:hypothetical protein
MAIFVNRRPSTWTLAATTPSEVTGSVAKTADEATFMSPVPDKCLEPCSGAKLPEG